MDLFLEQHSGMDVTRIPTVILHTPTTGNSVSSSRTSTTHGHLLWQMQGGTSTTLGNCVKSLGVSSRMTFLVTLVGLPLVIDGTGLVMVQMIVNAGLADLADGEKG